MNSLEYDVNSSLATGKKQKQDGFMIRNGRDKMYAKTPINALYVKWHCRPHKKNIIEFTHLSERFIGKTGASRKNLSSKNL